MVKKAKEPTCSLCPKLKESEAKAESWQRSYVEMRETHYQKNIELEGALKTVLELKHKLERAEAANRSAENDARQQRDRCDTLIDRFTDTLEFVTRS